jgi:hypothetical protein
MNRRGRAVSNHRAAASAFRKEDIQTQATREQKRSLFALRLLLAAHRALTAGGSAAARCLLIAITALLLSLASFVYFFTNHMTNVYGDGVAHVNIARKVVDHPDDSLWQRYIQIGTPWLPLQTVSMLPMVANEWMWRTGVAGSIISMLAFVIAAVALYLLARSLYRAEGEAQRRWLPVVSAGIFLLNPSALYMQATPMTELLFMAALAVAVYLLQRWVIVQTDGRLAIAALGMSLATLARYEAWPVAVASVILIALACRGGWKPKLKSTALYAALAATGPLYWLWHNWMIYDNALEFLTGPYSARGIYLQNRANLGWSKIFVGNGLLDVLLMSVTVAVCAGPFVSLIAAAGFTKLISRRRTLIENAPVFLLAVPFFFHVYSLYRGEIQIFPLSAFGLHNVRYGLPHLLAVALFAPATALLFKGAARRWATIAVAAIVAAQYLYLISEGPAQLAVYQEGYRNGVNARPARERAKVSSYLIANPPRPVILMHTGALGPVVSEGGLRFAEIIHEGTSRWHQIAESIPEDVSTVIVQQGDPLDERLRNNPPLARDLASRFEQRFSAGNIKLFKRKESMAEGEQR